LTQRLLAFARQQDLKAVPVDLAGLLHGMVELLERSLGPAVKLRLAVPDGLPPALADPTQIELAILNLALNARDAMPRGGTIDVALDLCSSRDRKSLRPGDYVRIRLADSGTGMDEATLARAVEPFFSTKAVGKGTGLGLSMVHGLADQLGGLLDISSEVGKGTTVDLWLPVAAATAEQAQAARPAQGGSRAAKVLLVEDDQLIAMSAVAMLNDLGHSVVEAGSGRAALAILESGAAVDVMMTDQAMPGMTGVDLALAARSLRPDMPILLVTGYADLHDGKAAGLPVLGKPYSQSQLQAAIDRLLSGVAI
jgi:CheY-like chemotaxis protein